MCKIVDYENQLKQSLDIINRTSRICTKFSNTTPIEWDDVDIFNNIYNLCLIGLSIDIDSSIIYYKHTDINFENIICSNINELYDAFIVPKINQVIKFIVDINNNNRIKDVIVTDGKPVFNHILQNLNNMLVNDNDIVDRFKNIYHTKYYIKYSKDELSIISDTLIRIKSELVNYINNLEMPTKKDWELEV